jgi:hypothetical protein
VFLADYGSQTDGAGPGLYLGQETSLITWPDPGFPQAEPEEWLNNEGTQFPDVNGTWGDGTVDPQLTVLGHSAAELDRPAPPWNGYNPAAPLQATPGSFYQGRSGFCETEFTDPPGSSGLYSAGHNAYPTGAFIPGAPVSLVAFSPVSHALGI